MTVKFLKNGKQKAVLKDNAQEPEGFKYLGEKDTPVDFVLPSGIKSLEELDEELEGKDLE